MTKSVTRGQPMISSMPIALSPLQMIRHRVELLVAEVFAGIETP
ncbi:MAG: hypothetical protein WAL32_12805 [Terriglobales bacterium]